MRRILIMLAVGAVLVAGTPVFVSAADDELFDTKAAAAHIEKGIAHLKNKDYDAAIKELDEAASINPDAEAYYYLGYAYYMKGKKGDSESRKKSIECFDKAYELNPGFTPSRFKPAETPKPQPGPKEQESKSPEVQPAEPSAASPEPAAGSTSPATDQQPAGQDNPPQPAAPFTATDKVKGIGTVGN